MRSRGEGSRERLMNAARRLYAETGFEATTTAAIARAARTSQSQLVKHFGDKRGVLAAILEAAWGELVNAVRLATERIDAPEERFRLTLDMLLSYLAREREFRAIFLREGRQRTRRVGGAAYGAFLSLLDDILRAMLVEGLLLPHVNPRALRSGLLGALANMLYESDVVRETGAALPFSEDEVRHMVLSFLAGSRVGEMPQVAAEPSEPAWVARYMELAEKVLGPGGTA